MRKILLTMLIITLISFYGCSKVVNTEIEDINAVVVETNYKNSYSITTVTMAGKTMIPITTIYPEEYNITLEYDGVDYYMDNEAYYNICNDKKGKEVKCELETKKYDDKTEQKSICKVIG